MRLVLEAGASVELWGCGDRLGSLVKVFMFLIDALNLIVLFFELAEEVEEVGGRSCEISKLGGPEVLRLVYNIYSAHIVRLRAFKSGAHVYYTKFIP